MYQFFVSKEQIGEKQIIIEGSDVNHIKNVLRMKEGEQICICNGEEALQYRCEILAISEDSVTAGIMWVEENGVELPSRIYLFQGLPKADKMELIIQKAVELGVHEIIPMETKRAVVKLDAKKEEAKRKRWNAIAESAAKQSKRMIIPEVSKVVTFAQAIERVKDMDVRLIPYELAKDMEETRRQIQSIQPGQSVAVMIGPEGGFDEKEIALALESEVKPITLGRRILRTETAGMTVLSILIYQLEQK